ncbi:MAG: cytochrome c biogenesis protein CcsA [Bacteroidales bacterium]|nr:cytochrome c biogenesis protein CcsA [Bacteroidales bacterium]
MMWIYRRGVTKRHLVLVLHLSFIAILVGALVTHFSSSSGILRLRIGETTNVIFTEDGAEKLPFTVTLSDFEVQRYPGSASAMDYVSTVEVDGKTYSISMNNILKVKGYRFYQSSFDEDEGGSILSVSHDPWGVTITYVGYALLFLCLVGFFFCRETNFRRTLSRVIKESSAALVLLMLFIGANASAQNQQKDPYQETSIGETLTEGSALSPKALPRNLADSLCNLFVYYNGRIAPMETMARDYVMKAYGKPSVKGFSSAEVFSGWIFYFDTWKNVPLKLKSKEKGTNKEDEKYYVLQSVASQKALRVFPYFPESDGQEGVLNGWLSPTDDLPMEMDPQEWLFVRKVFSLIGENVYKGDYEGALDVISKIAKYQKKNAGEYLPSLSRVRTEKLYNKMSRPMAAAMACVTLGMILFILTGVMISRNRKMPKSIGRMAMILSTLLFVYLTMVLILRWMVSGHIPMANGFEMMLLIAWGAMILTIITYKVIPIIQPLGFILTGFALLVAVLGESNPQITPLMPVLSSPLLSIHVASMMISYTLLGLVALNGLMGLFVRSKDAQQNLADISLVILYPGIFFLIAGTVIGAVWANVSWGSYWMWDPKETWAFVTCIVYASVFHVSSMPAFRNPRFFHWFCVIAFMCVLVTYFGVNFILGGMHGYA